MAVVNERVETGLRRIVGDRIRTDRVERRMYSGPVPHVTPRMIDYIRTEL